MPLVASLRRWSPCVLLIAACGGSDPRVTELSANKLDAQCEEWNSRVTGDPEVLEGLCRIRGAARALLDPQLSSMDPVVSCEMETQRCMTTPQADQFCFGELRPECAVSVDEVGSCVDVTVSQWRMAASRSCEEQLVRVMNIRQAQQLGMPLPDPIAEACHESDECFLPVVTINPNGGVSISDAPPSAGAGGMSGSAGPAGMTGAGAGGAGAGGAGAGGAGAGGAGEGSVMPDATCMAEYPSPDAECTRCVCSPQASSGTPDTGCLELYRNCFENPDPIFAMRCSAAITCMIEADCVGSACYVPCMAQIDAAAMYPSGSTIASCSMGEMDSSACRASSLLSACTHYDPTMLDGPCRQACM